VDQRLGHLEADPGRLAVVEPPPGDPVRIRRGGAFLEHDVEPAAGDELHGVEVSPVVLADAEDRHDVRVMEPAGGPGLAAEPGQVAVLRQELQRHVPAERALVCLADDSHAAAPDLADDPELPPGLERARLVATLAQAGSLGPRARLPFRFPIILAVQVGLADPTQIGHDLVRHPIEPADLSLAFRANVEMFGPPS
jgi:hypothetical protein